MERTIRALKIALPIVFLGFVLLIALNWNQRRVGRDRTDATPVVPTRTGEQAQLESRMFEDTQTIGGRVVSRIRARRVVSHSSNWTTLEEVQITIYRPNSLTYELVCPNAEFNSVTKEADAKGGVRVTSSDGVEIQTAQINFDGNRLTNDIPVKFKVDRWNGNAGGLDLDVQAETLKLFKKATATATPTATEPPMTLASEETLFRRRDNDVTFTGNVVMTRAADQLMSDKVIGRFTQDRKTLVSLEGNDHVTMIMSAVLSPGEDFGGRKTITCDRFFTEVAPDGQINAINAVAIGPAAAHALLDGPPKRDIVARGFRIALANKAVSELKADWGVVMKEFGETAREVSSDHVIVSFDPVAHRATTAFLEGSFRYSDPKTTASAFRANYDIANDRILLTTDPGWDATVVSDGQTLKAKQIEFAPKAQTAKATGEVIAQFVSKGGGVSADATNLFPAGKPVFVNSDTLILRQAQKVAIFTGNVRAWQETNTLLANEMQITGAGSTITARGDVRTVLFNTSGEARKTPMKSRSDQLTAKKNERRVDLTGSVRIDDEDRTMTSERSAFFFDANKKIERMESEEKVNIVERATSRTTKCDKAVYHVQKKLIYVDGKPATVTAPSGKVEGEQMVIDLVRNKVQIVSPTSKTQGTYKQEP